MDEIDRENVRPLSKLEMLQRQKFVEFKGAEGVYDCVDYRVFGCHMIR